MKEYEKCVFSLSKCIGINLLIQHLEIIYRSLKLYTVCVMFKDKNVNDKSTDKENLSLLSVN